MRTESVGIEFLTPLTPLTPPTTTNTRQLVVGLSLKKSHILRLQARSLPDTGQHPWTDFFAVVKWKNEIRESGFRERAGNPFAV